ncbi:cell envelope integrity protein TolA [Bradyrhizobium sp. AZCC 1578]|uniref:cell envelope integrity protein TolA n=1 Tax=Bradyrhizobium sp. AZCC 1578 TaxID=3117027 RepID=UPI003FA5BB85
MHDVTIVTTKKLAQAKVMGVPPEEFGIERGARNIKDCNYCFHEVVTKTEGQLIAEGFDENQIKALGDYTGYTDIETIARDSINEHFGSSDVNKSARLVKITEHYVRMDYEGNGRPCLYQVITGGDQGEILRKDGKECIEPFDAIPFATTTPVPITHRFFGRSIADLVMDIQRVKTALIRGALDNLYLHNNPRVEVAEAMAGPNTLDDLLVSRPGGVVRTKNPGGLNWQVVPDITGSVYPMFQYMDATRETRTGLSNQSQGIDANALQNQSATAVAQVFSASQMRMKLIARIMAEGVRDIFALLHGTIRKHGQQQQTVRLRNTWVPVDPRQWKTRADMTINVGLGTGGKAQQFAQVMALANVQKEMLAGGKANLVDDQALFNTASELTKIMGYKNPDKFFNDPSAKNPQTGELLHPPVPPPEDPKVTQIKVQAELKKQEDERKAQIEAIQARADIETNNKKVEADIIQNREKAAIEERLAVLQFQLDNARDQREHDYKMAQLQAKTAADREKHEQQLEAGVFKVAAGAEAHGQKMEQMKNAPKPKGGK